MGRFRITLLTLILLIVPGFTAPVPKERAVPLPRQMHGQWAIQQRIRAGQDANDQVTRWTIKEGEIQVTASPTSSLQVWKFSVDLSRKPAEIRIYNETTEFPGIVQVEGNTLRIAYNYTGEPRPTTFEGREGVLIVMKREVPK
jgi:uncharacterized protein (TIGR03067 family)